MTDLAALQADLVAARDRVREARAALAEAEAEAVVAFDAVVTAYEASIVPVPGVDFDVACCALCDRTEIHDHAPEEYGHADFDPDQPRGPL